jgi:hypothetical protein
LIRMGTGENRAAALIKMGNGENRAAPYGDSRNHRRCGGCGTKQPHCVEFSLAAGLLGTMYNGLEHGSSPALRSFAIANRRCQKGYL